MITLDQLNELQAHVGRGCKVYIKSYSRVDSYIQIDANRLNGKFFRYGQRIADGALVNELRGAEFMDSLKNNAKYYFDSAFNEEDLKK